MNIALRIANTALRIVIFFALLIAASFFFSIVIYSGFFTTAIYSGDVPVTGDSPATRIGKGLGGMSAFVSFAVVVGFAVRGVIFIYAKIAGKKEAWVATKKIGKIAGGVAILIFGYFAAVGSFSEHARYTAYKQGKITEAQLNRKERIPDNVYFDIFGKFPLGFTFDALLGTRARM
ncbi:MAG: hypothetical protein MPJ22_04185 [Pirellulales bacterium]|nr:hypothetical protein [Pirellulales bacterium]